MACVNVSFTVGDPCYVCDPFVNCYIVGGTCVDGECVCNYGFQGDACLAPVVDVQGGGFLVLRYFFGVSILSVLTLYALILHVYLWTRVLPVPNIGALWKSSNLPIVTTLVCALATFLRIFYYEPDPYAFEGFRVLCGCWCVDYFSTWLTYTAFALLSAQWSFLVSEVFSRAQDKSALLFILKGLRWYLLVTVIVLFLCAIIACPLSCICDGTNCPYQTPDYLYFISWQVFSGIAIIGCVTIAAFIIHLMRSQDQKKYTKRLVRFSFFVILVCVGLLCLLGYTISLFVDYGSTNDGFLASETLEVIFIELTIIAVLIILSSDRKKMEGSTSSTGSNRDSINSGNSKNKGDGGAQDYNSQLENVAL